MRVRLALLFAICLVTVLGSAASASACVIPKTLGVAFSIDDSGSMASTDPDFLRAAATGAGIDQLADGSVVAVSSFDSSSRVLLDPVAVDAANREALKDQVRDRLSPSGQTYYDLGLARAKRQLDAMTGVDKRAVIFLSDGAPNGGDYSDELAALANAGIPVFAIGFADAPGPKLAAIAGETGGQAYTVRSPGEAQAVFARIVSTLTCDATQIRESFTLKPNETRTFPFTIGPSDREFRALAAWLYGDVTVRIRRANGSYLVPGAELAGERFVSEATYASIVGRNPAVGGWQVEVTASPENSDDVDVSIDVFRRTSADPPDAFALTAPATGVRMRTGPATFSWEGARNAESYELEIDDQVVQTGIPRDALSTTVEVPAVGQHSWRVAAVNQFGRTLSERRFFTSVVGYKYVALGDSFSAGEGVPQYFEPKNACHRSKQAYPVFVQQPGVTNISLYDMRGDPALGISWGFQACSGAVTANLLTSRQGVERFVQLDASSQPDRNNTNRLPVDPNTSLVTVTIGGNDMKFADVLGWCGWDSSHCDTENYRKTGKTFAAYARELRDDVAPKLTKIYERIRAQAPNARVLVLGYPHLMPRTAAEQDCVRLKQRLGKGFTREEQNALRRATAEFNQTIADRANRAGMEFVAVDGYFAGHEPCGSAKNDWINSVKVADWKVDPKSFHPNEKGHKDGYAQAINDTLNPQPVPALTFAAAGATRVKMQRSGGVVLREQQVSCPAGAPACTVMLEATSRIGGRHTVIARTTFLVRAGGTRKLTFVLTTKARRAIRRARRLNATLKVTAYRGGWKTAQTSRITLRR